MPELPEVETVRRGLEPAMLGEVFASVEQRRPDLRFPLPERFAAADVERAMQGHVLAEAAVHGTYTLNTALRG